MDLEHPEFLDRALGVQADAAVVDTRQLLATRLQRRREGWPTAEDRFAGSTDVPRVELHHMETPSPLNPIGVKGAGEGGTIPAIAAIIAAIENALSPFKVKIAEAPITPSRLVELIRAA